MQFMLLFSRQGKLRLQKWYVPLSDKEKKKITRELVQTVLARKPKMCSFLEWRDLKVVYKRYASLYFCCAIENQDNELITLEIIHRYVELLDKYFGSVRIYLLPIPYFLLFTSYSLLSIPHSLLFTPYSLLSTLYSLFPIPHSLLPTLYFPFPTIYSPLPCSYSLLFTPYSPLPIPYSLLSTLFSLLSTL
uniref:AP complex mu/sigma subunit domain-containing protein n=1 Tax=Salmo trutta TaxID=8032 RepID=A0A674AH96_SALTR